MRASPTADSARTTTSLRLGDRTIAQSDEGLLAAEYALFDGADIVLRATDPVSVREAGYLTTAREALERLARAGVTRGLAEAAARATSSDVVASFARGPAARSVVARLGPHELFDGAIYRSRSSYYEGAWLDLAALSAHLSFPGAPIFLQVLHLVSALSEVAASTTVHLSTADSTQSRRAGERTHTRVDLEGALRMPDALARLTPRRQPVEPDAAHDRRMRRALVARVRERLTVDTSDRLRAHLGALEAALAPHTMELGPLVDPDLQSVERQLATGDATGIDEQLDEIERRRGATAGIRYLRSRAALLRGEQPPRSVAQFLSDIASEGDNGQDYHQAALRAARGWLAAGDEANARSLARRIVEDASAPDRERLFALEILEEVNALGRSGPPHDPTGIDASMRGAPTPATADEPEPPEELPAPGLVAARPATQRPRVAAKHVVRYEPELAENLTLPGGATEAALGINEQPRNPFQARIAMTRLARNLGRDYRLRFGKALRCNVLAVDAMQQHLIHQYAGAPIEEQTVAWELRRHGALLSEIIARALGGTWADVAPSELGYWAMVLPSGIRSWPIGRVVRFVSLGNRERDLVGYYLDLEASVRNLDR
jgi:hypothetical protein